jgi:hypothetical protein
MIVTDNNSMVNFFSTYTAVISYKLKLFLFVILIIFSHVSI